MNLQQFLQMKGVPFRPGKNSDEIYVCCPFCHTRNQSADARFRLGVNIRSNKAHCFNCDYKSRHAAGPLLKALRFPPTKLDHLVEYSAPVKEEAVELPEGFHCLASPRDSLERGALQYLLDRGISIDQVKRNNIGSCFIGRYAFRVVFPVYASRVLEGLVGRALKPATNPRYLNSVGKKVLYNFREPATHVVLLEGVFKCLRVEQILRKLGAKANAVGLLGHDLTEIQLEQLLKAKVEHATLWPDPDRVGRQGMAGIAEKLKSQGVQVSFAFTGMAADEATVPQLEGAWRTKFPYSWSVAQRLVAPGPLAII